MGTLPYNSNLRVTGLYITENGPVDIRTVVSNVEDLTNGTIPNVYKGIVVNVAGTGDLYVFIGTSVRDAKLPENWIKVGGDSSINLSEYAKLTDLDKYAKKEDLVDYITSSDAESFVKVEDIADVTSGFVTESDLNLYVKTEDIADFVKSADIKDFAKNEDLVDFLTASDVDEFVRLDELHKIISEEVADKFVSQSDLDVYVKTEDLIDFVTSSELDARIATIDIPEVPTNVSAFYNDAGYLTENTLPDFLTASDVEDFVKVDELNNYATKEDITNFVSQSDLEVYAKVVDVVELLEKEDYAKKEDLKDFLTGSDVEDFVKISDIADVVRVDDLDLYVKTEDAVDFLTASDVKDFVKVDELPDFLLASDLDGFATVDKIPTAGSFPAASNIDSSVAPVNGYAIVQDVMDYVNALLEKKKDELVYAYITGYALDGAPTDITVFNKFLLNDSGDTEFEIYAPQEIGAYANNGDDLPSIKLTVDIPSDYSIKSAYQWNTITSEYSLLTDDLSFGQNPRYASREIDEITYNSYVRGPVNSNAMRGTTQYKIIITKNK